MKTKPVTWLREPCGGDREVVGEASVAVPVGGAIEHRKSDGPECRVCQIGRRQHWPHREKVRGGRAPRCQRTHARRYAFCRELGDLRCAPGVARGRDGKEKTEVIDVRNEEVG